ncbi:hypothetical protein HYT74_00105 [Candidatus Daviesbacteria bacterium]|nr:hypothetical protein [Candidatus Daviesbacteria bacterium]
MTQKNLKLKGFYSTSDLAMATAISLWFPIDAIDRQDPRKASFRFKRDEKFDKLLEAYWKRELKIEPQEYFNQLKAIKARLYAND